MNKEVTKRKKREKIIYIRAIIYISPRNEKCYVMTDCGINQLQGFREFISTCVKTYLFHSMCLLL